MLVRGVRPSFVAIELRSALLDKQSELSDGEEEEDEEDDDESSEEEDDDGSGD